MLPGGDKVVGVTGSLEIRSESRDGYEVEAADGPAVVLADTSRTSERSLILDYSQVFSHRQAVLSPLLRLTLSNVSRDSETDVTTTAGLGLSATLPEGWAGFAYLQQTPDVFGERRWGIEFGIRREY